MISNFMVIDDTIINLTEVGSFREEFYEIGGKSYPIVIVTYKSGRKNTLRRPICSVAKILEVSL